MNEQNNLWICWEEPEILPKDSIILSFLSPGKEEDLRNKFNGTLISARWIAQGVKDEARKIYINLIAMIGAIPVNEGKTLRESLKRKGDLSLWWFHKVTEKECESDPVFNFIIETLTVISVAGSVKSKEIVLFCGSKEVLDVLKNLYKVKGIRCERKYNFSYTYLKGILSRVKYFFIFFIRLFVIKRMVKLPQSLLDVVFSGFWDWSVKEDKKTGKLNDYYFKLLPEKLSSNGLKTGWFLWFDPYFKPGSEGRKLRNVLEPLRKYENLVILQYLITTVDLIKTLLNFKPYLVFLDSCKANKFKKAFIVKGINFFPLLKPLLSYGFLNSTIPHLELVYIAASRAFKKYQPTLSISFLELFLYSRAFYAGGKQGCRNTIHCAVQHASYCREKTYLLLNPKIEYEGYPDGFPVPKPDYIFAMGELGKEIFIESGFPKERIFLTGSTRYDHTKDESIIRNAKSSNVKNILLATTLNRNLEIEMIEAACVATRDLPQVKLFLRSHPFAKMDEHPDFYKFRDRIKITNGTFEEDLKIADLIMFSYSTVAEEALIRGIPVWQWLSSSYNGSVFRDLNVILSFYSVSDLRESLKKFISNSYSFIPNEKIRKFVLRQCFHITDGRAHERIASILTTKFYKRNPKHANIRKNYSN